MKKERPPAFGTAIGTGAVDGDGFRCALSCSKPLSSLLLSAHPLLARGPTGKGAPRSEEAFDKQGNLNSRKVGTASTNL